MYGKSAHPYLVFEDYMLRFFIILTLRASQSVFTTPDHSEGFLAVHVYYRCFEDFLLPQQIPWIGGVSRTY